MRENMSMHASAWAKGCGPRCGICLLERKSACGMSAEVRESARGLYVRARERDGSVRTQVLVRGGGAEAFWARMFRVACAVTVAVAVVRRGSRGDVHNAT